MKGGGFNKEGGTARSVGSNFHFFHLFAPLTVVLKKCYGGTTLRLVDFRPVFSFIGSPPPPPYRADSLQSFFFSLLSFVPYFVPLFLTHMVLFARSPRVLSPFLGLSPPERTVSLSSNPSDTSRHGRSPYVTDTIPLE